MISIAGAIELYRCSLDACQSKTVVLVAMKSMWNTSFSCAHLSRARPFIHSALVQWGSMLLVQSWISQQTLSGRQNLPGAQKWELQM